MLTMFPVINWGYWIIAVLNYYLLQIISPRQGQCVDIDTKVCVSFKKFIRQSFQNIKIGKNGLGRKARKGIAKGGATFAFRWFHIPR